MMSLRPRMRLSRLHRTIETLTIHRFLEPISRLDDIIAGARVAGFRSIRVDVGYRVPEQIRTKIQ
jgi:hypothetical protein